METFMNYTPIITGIWLIGLTLMMETENVRSAMVFKVIPFFLGLSCLFVGIKNIGLI